MVIRISISKKNRQHNGQNKKDKQRSTKHTHKTRDRVTQTPLKTEGKLRCSGRISSSCSTVLTLKDNFPIFSHLHTRLKWTCLHFTASVNIVMHFTPYWWLWYNSNYVGCIVHKLLTSELQFLYIGISRSYITYKWVTISLHWYLAFINYLQVKYNSIALNVAFINYLQVWWVFAYLDMEVLCMNLSLCSKHLRCMISHHTLVLDYCMISCVFSF